MCSRPKRDSPVQYYSLETNEMEPLLGEYRGKEKSGSETSFSTVPSLNRVDRPLPSQQDPFTCFDTETTRSRTQSIPRSKRKTEETSEVSRAKRPRSDTFHSYTPPSPTYSASQSGAEINPSNAGSVLEDNRKGSTHGHEDLLILDKTCEVLKTLTATWGQADKFVTELSQSTKAIGKLAEGHLLKATQQEVTTTTTPRTYEPAKTVNQTPQSKEIASEIVRRLKNEFGYAEFINLSLEMKHNVNLVYLLNITEGVNKIPHDIGPTMWFILPTLRKERENAYYTLLAHPYIAQKIASSAKKLEKKLKQEIVNFFDKSFTYQIAAVHRIPVLLTGPLLRLGGDALFKSTGGLSTGGEDYRKLDKYNHEIWHEIVSQSAEILSRNSTKQNSQMRSRGESSISSLGLTGLFLGNDQESDRDEGDESNAEVIFSSSKYRKLREDSGSDVDLTPPSIDSEGGPDEISYVPCEEQDFEEQDDCDQQLMTGGQYLPVKERALDLMSERTNCLDVCGEC
ncbi:hypothetical protein BKA64DRAFT_429934 [Cadophora sp. MPI-SDFR-AT-0126]|nr:hypothetical protein BKA64DRAFT_429934 [Leotiomycetes sp. MPI-SDFR-AT-0126]